MDSNVRYVGRTIATDITKKHITLEEYFDDATPVVLHNDTGAK